MGEIFGLSKNPGGQNVLALKISLLFLICLGLAACAVEQEKPEPKFVQLKEHITGQELLLRDQILDKKRLAEDLRFKQDSMKAIDEAERREQIAILKRESRQLELEKMRLAQVRQAEERRRRREDYEYRQQQLAKLRKEQAEEKERLSSLQDKPKQQQK